MKYQDYHRITWSKEDGCFIGTCPELFDGGCHGATRAEVAEQLEDIVEDVIADYQAEGKRIPAPARRSARFTYALNARRRTGLNQKQFATVIGVGLGTLRNWEQGRVMPRGAAKTLLEVIEDQPDIIRARVKPVSQERVGNLD
jgi:putative transcriptional regulator